MRYCNHCHRITAGEPLFCNFCGRSYDDKLCPHRHINPRSAQICSQCGSRELSTPHPHVPLWLSLLVRLLSVLPGVVLWSITVLFLLGFVRALLSSQQLLFQFMMTGLMLGFVWWLYMRLPGVLKRWLLGLFGRGRGGGGHDH